MLPKANPTVVYSALPDGGVLFSPSDETYFGLNKTGACVWENLHPVRGTIEELCAEVGRCFPDAEPERIQRDVIHLLGALAENGLVLPA
ncbi:MAG TPA: PqqD family protein [Gemmatimonadaceae bacterium]